MPIIPNSYDEYLEPLSSKFHDIYQKEARRQGDVRHQDKYEDLKESTKEFDRVLARFVIKHACEEDLGKMLIDDLED